MCCPFHLRYVFIQVLDLIEEWGGAKLENTVFCVLCTAAQDLVTYCRQKNTAQLPAIARSVLCLKLNFSSDTSMIMADTKSLIFIK